VDRSRNEDRDLHIWMNNPVRYAGETFYQSGYHRDEKGESTTLQVVANTGWMIPYTACMIVLTGLTVHFGFVLVRFLKRRETEAAPVVEAEVLTGGTLPPPRRPAKPAPIVQPMPAPVRTTGTAEIVVPLAVVAIFAIMLVYSAVPKRAKKDQPDLAAFGRLPVAYEGRVKPYDTVARTSLRAISGKESFVDKDDERQPAMRWLLDVISHSPEAEQHEVFRIEHFDVLNLFDLKRRKGYRYSFAELEPKLEEFTEQVKLAAEANQKNPESMSLYQKKVLELDRKLQLYLALRESHRIPEQKGLDALERAQYLIGMHMAAQRLNGSSAPLAAPFPPGQAPWESLPSASTRVWIADLAEKYDAKNPSQLSQKLVADMEDKLTEMHAVELVGKFLQKQNPQMTSEDAAKRAGEMYAKMPENLKPTIDGPAREMARRDAEFISNRLSTVINEILGGVSLKDAARPTSRSLVNILTAYQTGDASAFNDQVDKYHKLLAKTPPADYSRGKSNFEAFFNRFNPFLQCEVMYLFGFVLACASWLVWRRPLNWAAFAIIAFALAVHTAALVGRIIIYGRPPVTNLYSSAIFIGWGAVIFCLILELFFRIGVGNIVAAICGFATLLIAPSLAADGDTFTVMQAVLDTNFWLATHVVTITLGYATTFVAGFLGVLYVGLGIFTPRLSADLKRTIYRMIYGIVCFAILFSFVGTVLGGLWADDSWGRFWGWDPKENGALIIVLWNAIVLHARWGGLVKERGLALLAIGGNIVTAWSWFGVNELGVGLHSYGFTEGRLVALAAFVLVNFALIGIGLMPKAWWWSNRQEALAAR
jgi:ABC-type transport system involved in cytochrome c biogenesis permease subunit